MFRLPTRMLLALASAIGIICGSAITAAAAPVDVASDHIALTAYSAYVGALVTDTEAGRTSAGAYVQNVRHSCGGALRHLSTAAHKSVSASALLAFGQEIGGDLAIRFDTEAVTPFSTLSGALTPLRWSRTATDRTVSSFLNAERASLQIAQSNLCPDARALATHPGVEPAGTTRFLATYLPAAALAKGRLGPFLAVLSRYQTASEAGVIGSIRALAAQFSSTEKVVVTTDDTALVAALGLR